MCTLLLVFLVFFVCVWVFNNFVALIAQCFFFHTSLCMLIKLCNLIQFFKCEIVCESARLFLSFFCLFCSVLSLFLSFFLIFFAFLEWQLCVVYFKQRKTTLNIVNVSYSFTPFSTLAKIYTTTAREPSIHVSHPQQTMVPPPPKVGQD